MEPYSDLVASVWRQLRRLPTEDLREVQKMIGEHLNPTKEIKHEKVAVEVQVTEPTRAVEPTKPAPKRRGRPPKQKAVIPEVAKAPPEPAENDQETVIVSRDPSDG